jgi:asparagine synthase (glutamine-hydrolysing)
MCGIAGIMRWNGSPVDRSEIERMTAALAHRGPDGDGFLVRDGIALGHRRLCIIDLEGGWQPISNEDGSVAITFNGEIYNFQELATELKSHGHKFKTRSDTEVIVHAWEQWGRDCVKRFRGMFAFGLVDWNQRVVFLARDHFGIKPLCYSLDSKQLVFASEIQAIRALPDQHDEIDARALDNYLFLEYIPAPQTIFEHIAKLPPAHSLVVHFDGRAEPPERYWKLPFQPQGGRSLQDLESELESVLRDSVRAHLVADVPFGAFLSGGTDSSLIVSLMAQELRQPVRTFTIGFEQQDYNEVPFANAVAKRWNTQHHVEIVAPDAMAILPRLVQHYGEPFADWSALPTYYVSRLARQHVPMVLSGDGGDEGFAGYHSYKTWMNNLSPRLPQWKKLLLPAAAKLFPNRYGKNPRRTLATWQQCMIRCADADVRRDLWRPEYQSLVDQPIDLFEKAFEESATFPPLGQAQYLDYQTYLPNAILTKVDIASMMHGLEVRPPLLDVKVAEFAASVPPHFHFAPDGDRQWTSKYLLKRLLLKYFPAEFVHRRKQGFVPPVQQWFSAGGQLRSQIEERLVLNNALLHQFFQPASIRALLDNVERSYNAAKTLWALYFLELWLENQRHHAHV